MLAQRCRAQLSAPLAWAGPGRALGGPSIVAGSFCLEGMALELRGMASSCVCVLQDCPQCQPADDIWRFDGRFVTRVHRRARYRLFTPTGYTAAAGKPVRVGNLLNHRTTHIVKLGGSASISQHDEDWKDSVCSSNLLPYLWVGQSVFEVSAEHIWAEGHRCIQLHGRDGVGDRKHC